MNIFSLIGMVEGLAGPGAFDRAAGIGSDVDAMFREIDDRRDGRNGRYVPRGASVQEVAVHSVTPPRARFCCRRACRMGL